MSTDSCRSLFPGCGLRGGGPIRIRRDALRLLGLDLLFFHELPSAYLGRQDAVALDIIVVEHEVDVDDREHDKGPHDRVMKDAQREFAAEQRRHPDRKSTRLNSS